MENATSLETLLEPMRDKPDEALLEAIADALLDTLKRLHCGNFCHWDFKPRNLLVTRNAGDVVITPIDARSGRWMSVLTRRAYIRRDYRFLLREPLLRPLLERRRDSLNYP